jgi:hypothetical protein
MQEIREPGDKAESLHFQTQERGKFTSKRYSFLKMVTKFGVLKHKSKSANANSSSGSNKRYTAPFLTTSPMHLLAKYLEIYLLNDLNNFAVVIQLGLGYTYAWAKPTSDNYRLLLISLQARSCPPKGNGSKLNRYRQA